MNKISGKKSDFALLREDASRVIIGYGLKKVTGKSLYEWYEVYQYKRQNSQLSFQIVKDAILNDINEQTDMKILSGFVWTPEGGEPINVWLSAENQRNFSEAQRMAEKYGSMILPLTFKLGEADDEQPVYHTFETVEELDSFYTQAFSFVNQCLNEGWQRKDAIDWAPYEALFPEPEPMPTNEEEEVVEEP